MIEGLTPDDFIFGLHGMYECVPGRLINGRQAWQKKRFFDSSLEAAEAARGAAVEYDADVFMYYAVEDNEYATWVVAHRAQMDAAHVDGFRGWMANESAARTPVEIDESVYVWLVHDGTDGPLAEASGLRARVCGASEKLVLRKREVEAEQRALSQARSPERRTVVLDGLEEGHCWYGIMGEFDLMEDQTVHGRGVWKRREFFANHHPYFGLVNEEMFLYYSAAGGWVVNNRREKMEEGASESVMKCSSDALTPDQATQTWQTTMNNGTGFHLFPALSCSCSLGK
jgi:hypothetical protein